MDKGYRILFLFRTFQFAVAMAILIPLILLSIIPNAPIGVMVFFVSVATGLFSNKLSKEIKKDMKKKTGIK